MRNCLYISLFMLHFSAGCKLSHEWKTKDITGYTGGSVLLPCSCDDPQSTVETFTWEIHQLEDEKRWINALKYEKITGRLELFNESSPANLSLLIFGLRKEDEGFYKCITEPLSVTYVFLTVKGCNLVQKRTDQTEEMTGYLGGSVVLPCSCTETLAKPDRLKWKYYKKNDYKEIFPSVHIERYKNRGKLLNQTTPGNLSLHLSSLTKDDQGDYQCSASSDTFIFIKLYVKEKPLVHTIHSSTYQSVRETHELITIQQTEETIKHRPNHMPLYVVILIAVFASALLLVLLVFIYWRCKAGKNVKVTSDSTVLTREPENEDEVAYSTVFHVKTASTPASMQNIREEHTEYASINVK